MGEAANNPNSPQYRGPLPEFIIQPVLGWRLTPTPAWLEANQEALKAGTVQAPGPGDLVLEIYACAAMAYP